MLQYFISRLNAKFSCIVYSSDVHSSSRIYDSVIYFIDKRDNLWTKKKDNKNSTV